MKILQKDEAKKIVSEALNCAFEAVSHTLGPKGTNAVIVLDGKTTITNDGVSIIRQLELDEEYNIPLNIIKEACFNTENKSGDGTTTSIVLTKAIFEKGKELINKGLNPMVIRDEFLNEYNKFEEIIKSKKRTIGTIKEIESIATISTGGNEYLGKIIAETFAKVNFSGSINYKLDPMSEDINVEKIDGYNINCTYVGYQELPDELKDCAIVIYEGKISTIADLAMVATFNREKNKMKPFILISNFDKDALDGIFHYNNAGNRIYPFTISKFGKDREVILKESRFLTDSADFNKETPFINFEVEDFEKGKGYIKSCILKNDGVILTSTDEEKYGKLLDHLMKNDEKRYKEIKNGVATILVGGKTKVEADETLLRIEDAVNSVNSAIKYGVTIGGANILYKISNNLESPLSQALKYPLETILKNNGKDIDKLEFDLLSICKNDNIGYNAKSDTLEDLTIAGVIDPLETVLNSLKSAVSIATSLLTINCIITEKTKKYGGF